MFHLCRLRVHQRVPQVELSMYGNQHKIITYLVAAIVVYYALQIILPFLIWGLIGCIIWQLYLANRHGR